MTSDGNGFQRRRKYFVLTNDIESDSQSTNSTSSESEGETIQAVRKVFKMRFKDEE
jgi:hypothetical protein